MDLAPPEEKLKKYLYFRQRVGSTAATPATPSTKLCGNARLRAVSKNFYMSY